jgi:hypothetical protein
MLLGAVLSCVLAAAAPAWADVAPPSLLDDFRYDPHFRTNTILAGVLLTLAVGSAGYLLFRARRSRRATEQAGKQQATRT